MTSRLYCRVAVDSPVLALDRPFDYEIPERLRGRVGVGSVVRVVLHGRRMRAFVTALVDQPAVSKARPLSALVSPEPLFDRSEIDLARWAADRYIVSLGKVLHDSVPGRFSTAPSGSTSSPASSPKVGGSTCVLVSAPEEPSYLAAAIEEQARAGRKTLVICPRVDVAVHVAEHVPGSLVLHGEQRPSERAAAWATGRTGAASAIIGGRSALLAPVANLGLVAVASAHDRSLKSERSPRLHGLVMARRRAELTGSSFLATSLSPPLELAADDSVQMVVPTGRKRVRVELARPTGGPVTPRLIEVVRWALERGEDALVFAGRLGGTLRLRCTDCAWFPRCADCRVALAADAGKLRCRMCASESAVPDICPECGGELKTTGWGHSRIASGLEKAIPDASVVRFVRGDVPAHVRKPSIVVGTLAAAHGLGRTVGAVCVSDLDQSLSRPDFRAAEYAFQLLNDLAAVLEPGGRFLVQAREPEHHTVQAFTRGSYRYFAERELPERSAAGYPPYGAIVVVDAQRASCEELGGFVRAAGATLLGPVDSGGGKARALIRAKSIDPLLEPLRRFALAHPRARIDVDPVDVV